MKICHRMYNQVITLSGLSLNGINELGCLCLCDRNEKSLYVVDKTKYLRMS